MLSCYLHHVPALTSHVLSNPACRSVTLGIYPGWHVLTPMTMKRPVKAPLESKPTRHLNQPSYEDIISALDNARLNLDQIANLAKKIDSLYSLEANKIIQPFPTDLWNHLFQYASLPELPVLNLLRYRLVCRSWDKVIRSFSKINLKALPRTLNPFKMLQLFPLKSFQIPPIRSTEEEFFLLTGLKKLQISKKNYLSPDLKELAPLTNLTKLTLSSGHITSLGPLTSLSHLSLKQPFVLQRPEIDKLPHLSRLVADDKSVFPSGRGEYKDVDGNRYEGNFTAGLFNGEGTWTSIFGNVYKGNFVRGSFEGKGIWTSDDGDRYEGDFVDWKFNGYGTHSLESALRRSI